MAGTFTAKLSHHATFDVYVTIEADNEERAIEALDNYVFGSDLTRDAKLKVDESTYLFVNVDVADTETDYDEDGTWEEDDGIWD